MIMNEKREKKKQCYLNDFLRFLIIVKIFFRVYCFLLTGVINTSDFFCYFFPQTLVQHFLCPAT